MSQWDRALRDWMSPLLQTELDEAISWKASRGNAVTSQPSDVKIKQEDADGCADKFTYRGENLVLSITPATELRNSVVITELIEKVDDGFVTRCRCVDGASSVIARLDSPTRYEHSNVVAGRTLYITGLEVVISSYGGGEKQMQVIFTEFKRRDGFRKDALSLRGQPLHSQPAISRRLRELNAVRSLLNGVSDEPGLYPVLNGVSGTPETSVSAKDMPSTALAASQASNTMYTQAMLTTQVQPPGPRMHSSPRSKTLQQYGVEELRGVNLRPPVLPGIPTFERRRASQSPDPAIADKQKLLSVLQHQNNTVPSMQRQAIGSPDQGLHDAMHSNPPSSPPLQHSGIDGRSELGQGLRSAGTPAALAVQEGCQSVTDNPTEKQRGTVQEMFMPAQVTIRSQRRPNPIYVKYAQRRLPKAQRKLLDRIESWIPALPGNQFPQPNIPVGLLKEMVEKGQAAHHAPATRVSDAHPTSDLEPDASEVPDHHLTSSQPGVDHSSDSEEDSDEPLSGWHESPPRGSPLPPDSSASQTLPAIRNHVNLDYPAEDFPQDDDDGEDCGSAIQTSISAEKPSTGGRPLQVQVQQTPEPPRPLSTNTAGLPSTFLEPDTVSRTLAWPSTTPQQQVDRDVIVIDNDDGGGGGGDEIATYSDNELQALSGLEVPASSGGTQTAQKSQSSPSRGVLAQKRIEASRSENSVADEQAIVRGPGSAPITPSKQLRYAFTYGSNKSYGMFKSPLAKQSGSASTPTSSSQSQMMVEVQQSPSDGPNRHAAAAGQKRPARDARLSPLVVIPAREKRVKHSVGWLSSEQVPEVDPDELHRERRKLFFAENREQNAEPPKDATTYATNGALKGSRTQQPGRKEPVPRRNQPRSIPRAHGVRPRQVQAPNPNGRPAGGLSLLKRLQQEEREMPAAEERKRGRAYLPWNSADYQPDPPKRWAYTGHNGRNNASLDRFEHQAAKAWELGKQDDEYESSWDEAEDEEKIQEDIPASAGLALSSVPAEPMIIDMTGDDSRPLAAIPQSPPPPKRSTNTAPTVSASGSTSIRPVAIDDDTKDAAASHQSLTQGALETRLQGASAARAPGTQSASAAAAASIEVIRSPIPIADEEGLFEAFSRVYPDQKNKKRQVFNICRRLYNGAWRSAVTPRWYDQFVLYYHQYMVYTQECLDDAETPLSYPGYWTERIFSWLQNAIVPECKVVTLAVLTRVYGKQPVDDPGPPHATKESFVQSVAATSDVKNRAGQEATDLHGLLSARSQPAIQQLTAQTLPADVTSAPKHNTVEKVSEAWKSELATQWLKETYEANSDSTIRQPFIWIKYRDNFSKDDRFEGGAKLVKLIGAVFPQTKVSAKQGEDGVARGYIDGLKQRENLKMAIHPDRMQMLSEETQTSQQPKPTGPTQTRANAIPLGERGRGMPNPLPPNPFAIPLSASPGLPDVAKSGQSAQSRSPPDGLAASYYGGCWNCDRLGHLSRDCPKPIAVSRVQCLNCSKFGHFTRRCPEPVDVSKIRCRDCGKLGHKAQNCPEEAPIEESSAPPRYERFDPYSTFNTFFHHYAALAPGGAFSHMNVGKDEVATLINNDACKGLRFASRQALPNVNEHGGIDVLGWKI